MLKQNLLRGVYDESIGIAGQLPFCILPSLKSSPRTVGDLRYACIGVAWYYCFQSKGEVR